MGYTKQNTYTKGQKARAESVDGDFTAVQTAWAKLIEFTDFSSVQQIAANAAARANTLIGFDSSGNAELKQNSVLTGITTPGAPTANALTKWVSATELSENASWTSNGSGDITASDKQLIRVKLKDYSETINAIGAIGGGTQDIDLENGNFITATVDTSETTFTFSNPPATGSGGGFALVLTNGGSQTVNWPASVDWSLGTAPSLTASGVDVLGFITSDGGTTWLGFEAGLDVR